MIFMGNFNHFRNSEIYFALFNDILNNFNAYPTSLTGSLQIFF